MAYARAGNPAFGSVKILVDMNLSAAWSTFLQHAGHETKHWSEVGSHSAPDERLMEWAFENGFVIFTHDLDFGMLLHASHAKSPSVIQIRTNDVDPMVLAPVLLQALHEAEQEIANGALVTIYKDRHRISILPLGR
jgi:predicted nuclease of predicted toxin-antitoxin system